jgi:hypothetical protein
MSMFKFFDENHNPNQDVSHDLDVHSAKLALIPGSKQRYQISYTASLDALGTKVVDVKSIFVWSFSVIKLSGDTYIVEVGIESTDVHNANESFNQMIDFSRAFNVPLQKLILRLSSSGKIVEIINQSEIEEKWEIVKSEIANVLGSDAISETIIRNGDQSYRNSMAMLNLTLLYRLFFASVYGFKQIQDYKKVDSGLFTSQIFQETQINYEVVEQVKQVTKDTVEIFHETAITETEKIKAKQAYDVYYKPAMGDDFDYKIGYKASYIFNVNNGLLKKCTVNQLEYVNPNLIFNGTYLINQI